MSWLNRVTGKLHDSPQSPFVPGQWEYRGERPVRIRNAEAKSGDLLMPDSDGRCPSPRLGLLQCDPNHKPDADALGKLRRVGSRLQLLESGTWSMWVKEIPLLPDLDVSLETTPLERQINIRLGHLEDACARPRTHLKVEEERLVVSRCKKPSTRAPIVLAARSEDWSHRTLWGVRPRRVLGIIRDELFGIYENRIAVALVDHLEEALRDRIQAVRRVLDLLIQRKNYQNVLESSNYRRAYRILELWGEAYEDSGQLDHVKTIHRRLTALLQRVLALQDTILYNQIGGTTASHLQLRMTNLFTHDDVYRKVAELWEAWEEHQRSLIFDSDIQWRMEQDAAKGFDHFVLLLAVRALDVLGFSPEEAHLDKPLLNGGKLLLNGPTGHLLFNHDESGLSLLSPHAEDPLYLISLPAMLEAGFSISKWIGTIAERNLLIAALPTDKSRVSQEEKLRLRSLGNQGENEGPMFLSVAPWDLESVERVARAIRWYAWSSLYSQYPFNVESTIQWGHQVLPPRWLQVTEKMVTVIRPPAPHEKNWTELTKKISISLEELVIAQSRYSACAPKDPRENRKRLHLKKELEKITEEHELIQNFHKGLLRAEYTSKLLLVCPVCKAIADTFSFENTGDLFRCRCGDCDATWGQRHCGNCGHSFPFIDFVGNNPSIDLLEIDRRYGADVLAIPLDHQAFLCPHCGNRSDGKTAKK